MSNSSFFLSLAWLRGRRKEVPTTEEILKNVGIMQMKKINSKTVAEQNPFVHEESTVQTTPKFPTLTDFELPDRKGKK